jgi:hypothetical protein
VLQRLIEGKWTDEDIADPLSQMINLLAEKRDRALTQHWGIWLTKLDPERGLKVSIDLTKVHVALIPCFFFLFQLLMPKDSGKRRERPEEDIALLEQIQDASPAAGAQYLEYLVLQRRSSVSNSSPSSFFCRLIRL